jgi:malonyl-CoA O-methyltransferase
MTDKTPATRALDALAVQRVLRRQAAGAGAPWLHQEVAGRMAERLPVIRLQPELLLDWWAGPGGGGAALARAYPQARRVSVEPHPDWLSRSQAQQRGPWWSLGRRKGAPGEVLMDTGAVPAGAQLIWANMMLHAVPDPVALIERWHGLLQPGGFLMFSCLGPDSLRELRSLYRRVFDSEPTVDFVDMHDLGDMLVRAGFADPVMDQEQLTLTWPTPEALLSELRSLGGNAHPARFQGLRTPRWRARLLQALESLRGEDGRLRMRFEISYGHAFKGLPRVKMQSEARVSMDDMRAMARRTFEKSTDKER